MPLLCWSPLALSLDLYVLLSLILCRNVVLYIGAVSGLDVMFMTLNSFVFMYDVSSSIVDCMNCCLCGEFIASVLVSMHCMSCWFWICSKVGVSMGVCLCFCGGGVWVLMVVCSCCCCCCCCGCFCVCDSVCVCGFGVGCCCGCCWCGCCCCCACCWCLCVYCCVCMLWFVVLLLCVLLLVWFLLCCLVRCVYIGSVSGVRRFVRERVGPFLWIA